MYDKKIEIYDLGKKAQKGDELSLIKLIEIKRPLIHKASRGNEDCFQYIIEMLIKGIKKYKF
ncbi:MAG: helix-turn-helix domain-containing protein [Clostridia bacterium]|nr:helix-turn-helix domain-containing protein [Clostridia bacterium]